MTRDDRYMPGGLSAPDELTPGAIAALARTLRRRSKPAESIGQVLAAVEPLAEVARRWLDPADPIRVEAMRILPLHSPFPATMWADACERMFAPITPDALRAFVRSELDGIGPLRFAPVLGMVLAGNVPAPAVQAVCCGLAVGSAMLVKTAGEDRVWPVLLARSLAAVSPQVGRRLAVVHWPGESAPHNAALASSADAIVAFGGSEAMAAWTELTRGRRLVAHGPRTSLELIELPADEGAQRELADAVAADVAMYDQQGCLSPQQVYLVEGESGGASPGGDPFPRARAFARRLGEALGRLAACWPVGDRGLGHCLAIRRAREAWRTRRLLARLEGKVDPATGGGSTGRAGPWLLAGPADRFDWTLLGTSGKSPQIGPGGRTLLLSRVGSVEDAIEAIRPLAPRVQGVALHATADRDRLARRLRDELAIPYVCLPGQLQRPPFGWRNDNVSPLRSMVIDPEE